MFLKQSVVFAICQILCLKLVTSNPLPLENDIEASNGQLHYLNKRLQILKPNIPSEFQLDLDKLQQECEMAFASDDVHLKNQFLENYNATLRPEFQMFLQQNFDEQILNTEINFEAWYLEQLSSQVDATIKNEIATLLSEFKRVLYISNFNEKFESFAKIQDEYSPELSAILNADPESASLINIDLQFTLEYLEYLVNENIAGVNMEQIKNALTEVELAQSSTDTALKKQVIEKYDDINTKFGQFLFNYMHEFWFYKFSN